MAGAGPRGARHHRRREPFGFLGSRRHNPFRDGQAILRRSVGPVAEAANIQVCANLPNFIFLEHHGSDPAAPNADVPYRSEVVKGMIPDKDGYIKIPTIPGIGIDINEEECEKHPFQPRTSREISLDDIFTSNYTYLDRS